MISVLKSNVIAPTPEISRSFAGMSPSSGAGMRRFGIFESDLAIDFSGKATPVLITRILEQCTVDSEGHLPTGYFRELSVGKRLEYLLALAAGEEGPAFHFPFHCAGCGQEIELELTLEDIAAQQREADLIETVEVEIRGKIFVFRKPCGRDQENWAEMVFQDQREAMKTMINALALTHDFPESLDPEAIDLIDEAMYEADPLVNFLCRVTCAECNSPNEFLVDLCDVALGRLSQLQQQLLVMVHKLASHYHWSEKEIFDVPYWRRKEYLNLIAAGR